MTWIVGAASPMGFAVGISDIRVTFGDGSELGCLQKIYPMARFIAAGFAGSVEVGFAMLGGMAELLQGAPENMAYFPNEVADCLSPLARRILQDYKQRDRTVNSHLILFGAHPSEDVGIPGLSRCSVYVLKSPEFVPESARMREAVSIGSGSGIAAYREALANFAANPGSLIQMETAGTGASSLILSMIVQKTIERTPSPGISPHAHICLVRGGAVNIWPNDHVQYPPSGEKIEFKMPRVARSWDEFTQLVSADYISAYDAVC